LSVLCGLAVALLCLTSTSRDRRLPLLCLAALILAASVATSHAMARLDDQALLAAASLLHQLGAALWIGGIPYFLMALRSTSDGIVLRRIGKRFSQMSMAGVAAILVGGVTMTVAYIGSLEAAYGTAYGVMTSTKMALLCGLLLLGGMNYLLVERLRRQPGTPITRLRRFAEVEIGVGITVFFAAASLTSLPPATDLILDRVGLHEIVERLTPRWPSFETPAHGSLAIPSAQARLDAAAAAHPANTPVARAFVPGEGVVPPRNAQDIAWSEYNHHWSGLLVFAMGLLALAERAGLRWARHWPLLFLGLAAFLFLRSDPETWPLGDIGFWESFRDPEVVQHRVFVTLIIAFGLFEWGVRSGRLTRPGPALVFPLITAVGGALLLTHSHALANVREELLIEYSHVPLSLLGVAAGWSRWLELRLDPPGNRIASWIWPVCFVLIGFILMSYRES
jgi:putative copper resistance protein D